MFRTGSRKPTPRPTHYAPAPTCRTIHGSRNLPLVRGRLRRGCNVNRLANTVKAAPACPHGPRPEVWAHSGGNAAEIRASPPDVPSDRSERAKIAGSTTRSRSHCEARQVPPNAQQIVGNVRALLRRDIKRRVASARYRENAAAQDAVSHRKRKLVIPMPHTADSVGAGRRGDSGRRNHDTAHQHASGSQSHVHGQSQ